MCMQHKLVSKRVFDTNRHPTLQLWNSAVHPLRLIHCLCLNLLATPIVLLLHTLALFTNLSMHVWALLQASVEAQWTPHTTGGSHFKSVLLFTSSFNPCGVADIDFNVNKWSLGGISNASLHFNPCIGGVNVLSGEFLCCFPQYLVHICWHQNSVNAVDFWAQDCSWSAPIYI